jgi:hypothetical protein
MHHYRCQNVYISATASERLVDTLDSPPYNSPMPQLSSTGRLLMDANDMTNALTHPRPEVPFAHVGDDTIIASTQLAEIFKNSFQKPKSPELTKTCRFNTTVFDFSHAASVSDGVTTTNPYKNNKQHTITSEGGHTNDGPGSISEGAGTNAKYSPQKFVTR